MQAQPARDIQRIRLMPGLSWKARLYVAFLSARVFVMIAVGLFCAGAFAFLAALIIDVRYAGDAAILGFLFNLVVYTASSMFGWSKAARWSKRVRAIVLTKATVLHEYRDGSLHEVGYAWIKSAALNRRFVRLRFQKGLLAEVIVRKDKLGAAASEKLESWLAANDKLRS